MRWYREGTRELIANQAHRLVALADEEVLRIGDHREARRGERAAVPDRGVHVLDLALATGELAGALTGAAEVEPQREPAVFGARARDLRDERIAHRPAVRGQRMGDDDDPGRRRVRDAK